MIFTAWNTQHARQPYNHFVLCMDSCMYVCRVYVYIIIYVTEYICCHCFIVLSYLTIRVTNEIKLHPLLLIHIANNESVKSNY